MTFTLRYYLIFFPLGVLGLFRWSVWMVRRIPAAFYRPYGGDFSLPMTIVVPVYQEDPDLFAKAIESWIDNQIEEVILVIDSTDERCIEIGRWAETLYPCWRSRSRVTVIVTDVPGKRDALRKGWEAATTPLVALVDSDVIWSSNVAEEVAKPFADERIGGVATRQNVYNPKGFLPRINDIFLDYRYFDENAAQTRAGRAVSCLSGRTAVYRRELLLEMSEEFMSETFLGVPCLSGDDKRLTTLLLEKGWLTYLQRSARVWSTFPSTIKVFYKQRIRWARNTWRSDMRALTKRWVWSHPFLAFSMIDKAVGGFTVFVSPAFMIYGLTVHKWLFCTCLAVWWWVSRSIKNLPHLRRRPLDFFMIPAYVIMSFLMGFIKLRALLLIRSNTWGTRPVAVVDGEVVRTGGGL